MHIPAEQSPAQKYCYNNCKTCIKLTEAKKI